VGPVPSVLDRKFAGTGSAMARGAALRRPAGGLVLLALLIMLILVGVGALAAGELWATTLKREREAELLFVGDQYRRAIAEYWKMSPGRRSYPVSLDSLLTDERFPNPVHHLRRLYRDPMTEMGEFEVIKQANGLTGVHSTSQDAPIKRANFPAVYKQFEQAEDYSQWQFVFAPPGTNPWANPGAVPPPLPGPTPTTPQGPAPGVPVPQAPTGR
jgi:type II secretory pathway pseudopilin PulG